MTETTKPRWTIPLADTSIGEEEVEAVARVLRSGWVTAGAETRRFEEEFARGVGAEHAFAMGNGTAALHLANVAAGVGPGDEVICPVVTFVATANASRYTGADVVFADVVGPDDLTLCPADVERKITPRTRAISVVHYAGFACDMDAILDLARRHDLKIVEDCAHAPMARCRLGDGTTPHLGTLGLVGCFSFFGNKNLTTGEGGMATTDDAEVAERLRCCRSHGMTTASYDRYRGHAHGYDVTELGFNYRIDDVRSAIGRVQLGKLDALHARRREVFRWYLQDLAEVDRVRVPFADRDLELATPHILSVVVERDGEAIRRALHDAGVQTSRHYDLVTSFSTYRESRGNTPVAAGLDLMTLPFGPGLGREQVARIAGIIRDA
jgi:dTDP-4-amino-4,6-dideoxygalactose transaminase